MTTISGIFLVFTNTNKDERGDPVYRKGEVLPEEKLPSKLHNWRCAGIHPRFVDFDGDCLLHYDREKMEWDNHGKIWLYRRDK